MSLKEHFKSEIAIHGKLHGRIKTKLMELAGIPEDTHSGTTYQMVLAWMMANRADFPNTINTVRRNSEKFDAFDIAICDVLDGLSKEDCATIIELAYPLFLHQPITPLTGEDSEWVEVSENLHMNRRCIDVFKCKTRGVFQVDRYPHACYMPEHGIWDNSTGSYAIASVTFPFDWMSTKPDYTRFMTTQRDVRLPDTITPDAFMAVQDTFCSAGYSTMQMLRKQVLVHSKECYDRVYRILDLIWASGTLTEPLTKAELFRYEEKTTVDSEETYNLQTILGRIAVNIPVGSKFLDNYCIQYPNGSKAYVAAQKVLVPDGHYQRWLPLTNRNIHATMRCGKMFPDDLGGEFFIFSVSHWEEDKVIYLDRMVPVDEGHLYTMRRELGLAHPKRKDDGTTSERDYLHVNLSKDDPNPVEMLNRIVDEYSNDVENLTNQTNSMVVPVDAECMFPNDTMKEEWFKLAEAPVQDVENKVMEDTPILPAKAFRPPYVKQTKE